MADKAAATSAPEVPQPGGAEDAPPPLPDLTHDQLLELLDKAGDDPTFRQNARSRRWVGGIAGDIAQQQRESERQQHERQKAQADRDALKQTLREDPVQGATKVLEAMDQADEALAQSALSAKARAEAVAQVGAVVAELPDEEKPTKEEWQTLQDSLRGVPDDRLVTVFTKNLTQLLKDKAAEARYQERHKKDLEEERKAWEKEHGLEKIQRRATPSPRQAATGNAQDNAEPDWLTQPVEWAAWDKRQQQAGRGIYAARYRR